MIKCDRHTIGPAVSLDCEKEVEEDEFYDGWKKVACEADAKWDLV